MHKQRVQALQEFKVPLLVCDEPEILGDLENRDVGVMRVGAIQTFIMRTDIAVVPDSAVNLVEALGCDFCLVFMRVGVQTREASCDVGSDLGSLGLEEPVDLSQGEIIGEYPQRYLAVMMLQAVPQIVLSIGTFRVHVSLKDPVEFGYEFFRLVMRLPLWRVVRDVEVWILLIRVQPGELMGADGF